MRGFFDFETTGWAAKDKGNEGEEITPLSYALLTEGGKELFKHRDDFKAKGKHIRGRMLAEDCLETMWGITNVKEWWAHNLGNFDGLFLSTAAMRLGWEQSARIAGGARVVVWEFWPKGSRRKVKCCDTFALVPDSLKNIAKSFELRSQKVFAETDYSGSMADLPLDKLIAGNMADCKVGLELLETLDRYFTEWGGKLRATFSSSALSCVKANLKAQGKEIPKLDEEINALARKAYFGARIEVFRHMPQEGLIEYDVNSSYPASMSKPLPWHFVGHYTDAATANSELWQGRTEGLFKATVSVPEMEFPPLPYKINGEGSIFFPVGTWEGWFTKPELRRAMQMGVSVEVTEALVFSRAQPFADFINDAYKVKATATGALRQFAKYVLNGAYGKFAEKPEKSELRIFDNADDARVFAYNLADENCEVEFMRGNPCALVISRDVWSPHTHYAVAAYITAYSRLTLLDALTQSKGAAYCDTDAVHCTEFSGATGNKLGQWKLEADGYKARFYAPKIYRLTFSDGEEKIACKGFPVKPEVFDQLITGQPVRREAMKKIKTQAREGNKLTMRLAQEKEWRGVSNKRCPIESPDGATRAWSIDELGKGLHLNVRSPAFGAKLEKES